MTPNLPGLACHKINPVCNHVSDGYVLSLCGRLVPHKQSRATCINTKVSCWNCRRLMVRDAKVSKGSSRLK